VLISLDDLRPTALETGREHMYCDGLTTVYLRGDHHSVQASKTDDVLFPYL
jgi:hypothetical protein